MFVALVHKSHLLLAEELVLETMVRGLMVDTAAVGGKGFLKP